MRRFVGVVALLAVLAVAGLAAGVFVTSGGASPKASEATTHVTVLASEFKFKLSRRSVPTGTVIFKVVNKGKISHNFKIAGKKTPNLLPGKSATLKVKISKKGRYAYTCTLLGHAQAGMKGVLAVGTKPVKTTSTQTTTSTSTLTSTSTSTSTSTTTITGPASTITVGMFEYRFDLSQTTVPSGPITFVITNRGAEVHNFDIGGVKSGALLAPGQSETWTVGLAPGTYQFVCDVPFHAQNGMIGALVVTAS
jgi:uncharacterized cupredoxin-like copper-binding protein